MLEGGPIRGAGKDGVALGEESHQRGPRWEENSSEVGGGGAGARLDGGPNQKDWTRKTDRRWRWI
eukprot:1202717-Lingulodinium_polyedra.AAC.1